MSAVSQAASTLAHIGHAKRRAPVLAAAAALRASLPPRSVVPLTSEETKAIAQFMVALKDMQTARLEADNAMRLVGREEYQPFHNRMLDVRRSLMAAAEAVGLNMSAITRGVL